MRTQGAERKCPYFPEDLECFNSYTNAMGVYLFQAESVGFYTVPISYRKARRAGLGRKRRAFLTSVQTNSASMRVVPSLIEGVRTSVWQMRKARCSPAHLPDTRSKTPGRCDPAVLQKKKKAPAASNLQRPVRYKVGSGLNKEPRGYSITAL
jgi:hypothetical protein